MHRHIVLTDAYSLLTRYLITQTNIMNQKEKVLGVDYGPHMTRSQYKYSNKVHIQPKILTRTHHALN